MMLLVLLLANTLAHRVVPGGLGAQSGNCYAHLRDGTWNSRGAHYDSTFVFDRDFALESYYMSEGGGMGAYKRYGSEWCVITRGGGAFSERELEEVRIPAAVAKRLFRALARKVDAHR